MREREGRKWEKLSLPSVQCVAVEEKREKGHSILCEARRKSRNEGYFRSIVSITQFERQK